MNAEFQEKQVRKYDMKCSVRRALILLTGCVVLVADVVATARQPNIVLILADDLVVTHKLGGK
jgi:hypothetical protein